MRQYSGAQWHRHALFLETEVAELEEMLTAATDTAVQRGNQLDQLERYVLDLTGLRVQWRHSHEMTGWQAEDDADDG